MGLFDNLFGRRDREIRELMNPLRIMDDVADIRVQGNSRGFSGAHRRGKRGKAPRAPRLATSTARPSPEKRHRGPSVVPPRQQFACEFTTQLYKHVTSKARMESSADQNHRPSDPLSDTMSCL
jgi:hypothetical protein